jgi:DNA-binding transcriptional LysR family regulator
MLPDIDSLALFIKAAEYGNLTKAATSTHMSLAAASRRIALLEHRFKTTLFSRTSKGLQLTPAGDALLRHAKNLLFRINKMQSEMTAYESGSKGVLKVRVSTSVLTHSFPKDLVQFLNQYPDFKIIVSEEWSTDIVRALLSAEADVGFVIKGTSVEGLETFTYGFDQICAIFPKNHPLSKLKRIKLADFLKYDIVGLEANANFMKLVSMEAAKIDRILRVRIEVKGFEAVVKMIKAGLGVGLLPFNHDESIELPGDDLIGVPIEEDWAIREILICIRKNAPRTVALTNFLSAFAKQYPST